MQDFPILPQYQDVEDAQTIPELKASWLSSDSFTVEQYGTTRLEAALPSR